MPVGRAKLKSQLAIRAEVAGDKSDAPANEVGCSKPRRTRLAFRKEVNALVFTF